MIVRDWIELSLVMLSFILAVLSVVFVVLTIRQNNRMIRNSTRPYVVAYAQVTKFQGTRFYLVIRNYGKSSAIIDKMDSSIDLKEVSYNSNRIPFSNMEGTLIAPGQSMSCALDDLKIGEQGIGEFEIALEYHDSINKYKEVHPINFKAYLGNVLSRSSTPGDELKIISYTLQDMVEKQL